MDTKQKCGHKSDSRETNLWTQNGIVDTKNGRKRLKMAVFGVNRSVPRNLYIYIADWCCYLIV